MNRNLCLFRSHFEPLAKCINVPDETKFGAQECVSPVLKLKHRDVKPRLCPNFHHVKLPSVSVNSDVSSEARLALRDVISNSNRNAETCQSIARGTGTMMKSSALVSQIHHMESQPI